MSGTPNRARRPTHPGAILREDVLPALKMSVADAAGALGISRQTLHRIVAEKAAITPDMAVRIGKFCGNGPELWLAMQQSVDLWDSRRRLAAVVEKIPTPKVAA
jgi:addiction module HigA family antidote